MNGVECRAEPQVHVRSGSTGWAGPHQLRITNGTEKQNIPREESIKQQVDNVEIFHDNI